MRTIAAIVLAAAAATATTAFAQPDSRLSDAEYMQAARCAGLASADLTTDTAPVETLLKAQGFGRMAFITEQADHIKADAAHVARRAKGPMKEKLSAELAGPCKRFLG